MYSIVIAPEEGEPEVASDEAMTIEYALSVAASINKVQQYQSDAQQYQSDAQQSQRIIQEVLALWTVKLQKEYLT